MSEHQTATSFADYIESVIALKGFSIEEVRDIEKRLQNIKLNMIYKQNRGPIGGNCQENSGDPSGYICLHGQ